jgi:hypothetical protein
MNNISILLRFPAEILTTIFKLLDTSNRRSLLLVCRYLRSLVLPLLFDTLDIRLGAWENMKPILREAGEHDADEQFDLDVNNKSMQQLLHIKENILFGRAVKSINVYAYSHHNLTHDSFSE